MPLEQRRPRPRGEDEALRVIPIATEKPQDTATPPEPQSSSTEGWLDALLAAEPAAARWAGCVGLIVAEGCAT